MNVSHSIYMSVGGSKWYLLIKVINHKKYIVLQKTIFLEKFIFLNKKSQNKVEKNMNKDCTHTWYCIILTFILNVIKKI